MPARGERRRYSVGVRKLPHADRDVERGLLGPTGAARGYRDVLGADAPDRHPRFGVGAACAYTAELTDIEAAHMREQPHCRYVVPDDASDQPHIASEVPKPRTLDWMGAKFPQIGSYPGTGVPVAILDQGTTPAARTYMNWTLVARAAFDTADPPPAGTTYDSDQNHGCLCGSAAIPAGGSLLDGIIVERSGATSPSLEAAGIVWACDQGAKVINISYGGTNDDNRMAPVQDAIDYMTGFDCTLFCSAGNDATLDYVSWPAAFAYTYPHVHALMAYDEVTGALVSVSNYTTATWVNVAAGNNVTGVTGAGAEALWYGTSTASPVAAGMCNRIVSGGFSAKAASAAMKRYTRDTGQTYQGGGAIDLRRALSGLGALPRPLSGRVLAGGAILAG